MRKRIRETIKRVFGRFDKKRNFPILSYKRGLCFEQLEQRQLLSISPTLIPQQIFSEPQIIETADVLQVFPTIKYDNSKLSNSLIDMGVTGLPR